MRPHRLSCLRPSLISHGPNTSIPVYVNGVVGLTRSSGRSYIFYMVVGPRILRHLTHLAMKLKTAERPFMIQYPACLMALCVIPRP